MDTSQIISGLTEHFINDVKISHLLAENNPFKKFMYHLENKTKHGWGYKSFCILCLLYGISTQIFVFFDGNQYAWAMLPLTLSLCCYIGLNYHHVVFQSKENIEKKMKYAYWQIFFISYSSIILGILIINYTISSDNGIWNIKFSSDNFFFIYSIIIGFLLHLIFLYNNIFVLYIRTTLYISITREKTNYFLISFILFPLISIVLIWATYDSFLSKEHNIFFQSLCLFLEGHLSYTILYILSVFILYLLRNLSFGINKSNL
jgi:membrane protein